MENYIEQLVSLYRANQELHNQIKIKDRKIKSLEEYLELVVIFAGNNVQGQTTSDSVGSKKRPSSAPPLNVSAQSDVQLKLYLFPIDIDDHSLSHELMLSRKMKISLLLEYLKSKLGNSGVALEEIILFPYEAQSDDLAGSLKWSENSIRSVAEVYYQLGSPTPFRLRYAWCSDADLESTITKTPLASSARNNVIQMLQLNECFAVLGGNPKKLCVAEIHNTLPQCAVFCDTKQDIKGSTLGEGSSQQGVPFSSDSFKPAIAEEAENDNSSDDDNKSAGDECLPGTQHAFKMPKGAIANPDRTGYKKKRAKTKKAAADPASRATFREVEVRSRKLESDRKKKVRKQDSGFDGYYRGEYL